MTIAAASMAAPAFGASQNDVIVGNGGAGPYSLTWKNILYDTVIVSRSGSTLTRTVDYTVDPVGGQITFTTPIDPQVTVLVQYQYDPSVAQRVSTLNLTPLKFDLDAADNHETYVSATLLPTAMAVGGAQSGGDVAFSLGSQWKGTGHNELAAQWFFDPSVRNGSSEDAPMQSAMGFAVKGVADAGKFSQLSFGFHRADTTLITSNTGLQNGQQTIDMGLHVAPDKQLTADVKVVQTDPLDPGSEGTTQSTVSIAAKPVAGGKTTPGVDVTATNTTTQGPTDSQQTALGVTVGQNQKVTLTTGVNLARTQDVQNSALSVGLTVHETPKLTVTTGVNVARADDVEHSTLSLSTVLKPLSTLEVNAAYQNRTASAADTDIRDSLDTATMQVSIQPAKALKVIGNYGVNPLDGGGMPTAMTQRGLNLQSTFGRIDLTGGYNWNRPAGASCDDTALKLGIGWKMSAHGKVTAGYQQMVGTSMTNTSYPWLTQYSLGYTHTLGQSLNLSVAGTYNAHPADVAASDPDLTGTASVGLKF